MKVDASSMQKKKRNVDKPNIEQIQQLFDKCLAIGMQLEEVKIFFSP